MYTPLRAAHVLPGKVSATSPSLSRDALPPGPLPTHRPDYFYIFEPARFDPPLDPASAQLSLVAEPVNGSTRLAELLIPVTITEVNPALFSVRSPQLDGPWVRLQYEALARRATAPTRPVLVLKVMTADRRETAAFGLSIERPW